MIRDLIIPALEALLGDARELAPGACVVLDTRVLKALAKARALVHSDHDLENEVLLTSLFDDLAPWFSFLRVNVSGPEGERRLRELRELEGWLPAPVNFLASSPMLTSFSPTPAFFHWMGEAWREFPDKSVAALIERGDPSEEQSRARTHLLAFYVYGTLLAFGEKYSIRTPTFAILGQSVQCVFLGPVTLTCPPTQILRDVLSVYGRLTTAQLKTEVALETIIRNAKRPSLVTENALRMHFVQKFGRDEVRPPETLFGTSSAALSRTPIPTYASLHDMAVGLDRLLGVLP